MRLLPERLNQIVTISVNKTLIEGVRFLNSLERDARLIHNRWAAVRIVRDRVLLFDWPSQNVTHPISCGRTIINANCRLKSLVEFLLICLTELLRDRPFYVLF